MQHVNETRKRLRLQAYVLEARQSQHVSGGNPASVLQRLKLTAYQGVRRRYNRRVHCHQEHADKQGKHLVNVRCY